MTIYSELQQNVTEYRNAQDNFWIDLQTKIIPFHNEMLIYFGVAGKTLRFEDDTETPVIIFGQFINDVFTQDIPLNLEKDENDLELKFAVRVLLSKAGSEMVDTGLTFRCALGKDESGYRVRFANRTISCPESNGKLNFKDAFDYILQRLYQFTDKSKF
ncbi:hypothetical protein EKN24_06765 [Enterobacter asburiae]|uniref:hypothetical protein n=1 Tax=Enterobacter TaxID=547 RepID=UPI000F872B55|nr:MULTISPECIES: hypothetical protein [Enterobacter]MCK7424247.1 hypothetical protein [Enterobacter bugandensis]RUN97844.1 hypothetical protein EKN24_06765 [Enterobacter asburiae]